MGIRIKKVAGYGIQPFEASPEVLRKLDELCEMNLGEILSWIEKNSSSLKKTKGNSWFWEVSHLRELQGKGKFISNLAVYNPEMGIKDLLVLRPVSNEDSLRYNDLIDWLEERVEDPTPRVRFVEDLGIPPNNPGEPPVSVLAAALYLGIDPSRLRECVYTYWC